MCGICGIVTSPSDARPDEALLRAMADTLRHRGPDDEGYHVGPGVGLGMRRLSIIDVEGGHQPIYNEDGTICVVCNGEIYNFPELADFLRSRGHTLKTRSDTEVIVHLYEEFGEECVRRMNGMFALAVWDAKARSLFMARDRMGKKPLFYAWDGRTLVFGSEVKAVLASGLVERSVDLESLHHFLSLNYMPWDRTMLREVRKLLPGHRLSLRGGQLRTEQYWDIRYDYSRPAPVREYAEGLLSLMRRAVERRLISDVPLGFFLSGGIDSSTIVALACRAGGARLKTFSIGFEEKSYNELSHARFIAQRFGTEHYEHVVRPDVADLLPRLVWHSDEPSADSSIIPTYYLSQMTRRHVTVALSGDGGDEMFGGYLTYLAYKAAAAYRRLPAWLRGRLIEKAVEALPVSSRKVSLEYQAKRFVRGSHMDPLRAHYWWNGAFGEEEKAELYTPALREALRGADTREVFARPFDRYPGLDAMSRLLYVDAKLYLADDILVKVDRASMANSLEVRAPFMDHELVEFVARIPPSLKIRGAVKKYILKKATEGILPRETRARSKKGFSIPIAQWLRGDLREIMCDHLSPSRIARDGYFRPEAVRRLVAEHLEGRRNNAYYIWALLIFQIWHGMFVSGAPASGAGAAQAGGKGEKA